MAPDQVRGGHLEKPGHDLKMAGAIYHEERGVTGEKSGGRASGSLPARPVTERSRSRDRKVWKQQKEDLPRHAPGGPKKNVFTNRRK